MAFAQLDVDVQLLLWGWCVTGNPADPAARLSERIALGRRDVDGSYRDLAAVQLTDQGREIRVPEWFALWWVGEYVRRLGLEGEVLGAL